MSLKRINKGKSRGGERDLDDAYSYSISLTNVSLGSLFVSQNWWTWEKTLRQTVRLDPSVMICSTGKQRSWDQMTPHMQEAFSFWTSTFPPTIPSSHPRCTLRPVSITVTSTRTEAFALIFSRISGVRHWRLARCCFLSVLFLLTPTQMILWFQILPNSWRQTGLGTTVLRGSGLQSMQCSDDDCILFYGNYIDGHEMEWKRVLLTY